MKVNIIKAHSYYNRLGEHDVEEGRGLYLINVGVAEPVIDRPVTESPDTTKATSKEEIKPGSKARKENKVISPAKNIK